jgi:seryl-tRNA synthetase
MSIITDALKLAASLEKTISKQENEIAKLKAQVESLTWARAAADESARLAKEALKIAQSAASGAARLAKKEKLDAINGIKRELKVAQAELKVALKTPKIPKTKPLVPTNDALGQVKRKLGRPKKAVEPEVASVDPRQIPIPDLGSPIAPVSYSAPQQTTPPKGITHEFV